MTTQDETPTELKNHIRVHADGVDEPLFFEQGTSDEAIQRAVQDAQHEATTTRDQADKTAMFEHLPEHLAAAGGLAGAVGGAASPVPGGIMFGAGLGSTGGYYAGKAIQDFSRNIEPTIGRISDNVVESLKTGALSGIGEAAAPLVGSLLGPVKQAALNLAAKLGNKLFVPKPPSELVKASEDTLSRAGSPGLTLGQLYDDPASKHAANIMENLAYNSMTTRIVNDVRNRQSQALKDHISALMDNWSRLPHEDAVQTLGAMVKDNFETLVQAPMKVAMDDLRTQLPGRVVELTNLFKDISKPGNTVLRNGVEQILKKSRGMDPATYDTLIQAIQPTKGSATTQARAKLTLDQAMRLKTAFDAYGRRKVADEAGQHAIIEAQMQGAAVDKAIKDSLHGTPTLLRSYESAQQMYAEGISTYKNKILKDAFATWEKEPGMFAEVFLNENKPTIAKAMRAAVGDQVWKKVVEPKLGAHLLLESFGKNMDGPLSGTALAGRIQSLAVNGTIDTAFTKGTYQRLLDLARTIEHVTPTPKGAGSVLIQLSQAGAIGAVPGVLEVLRTGDITEGAKTGIGVATTVLLAPRMLGKLVADPRFTEAFKKGLVTSQQQGKPSNYLLTTLRQLAIPEVGVHTGITTEVPQIAHDLANKLIPTQTPTSE